MLLFTLCLFKIMGLGYFGGQLVYAGAIPDVEKIFKPCRKFSSTTAQAATLMAEIFFPNLPLRSAPQLQSNETFIEFVGNPRLPDGLKGSMPAFTEQKLSDQQAHELYFYIINGLARVKVSDEPK